MPAKRTGKASSRQSRQRRQQQRSSQRAPLQRPADVPVTDASLPATAAPPTPAVVPTASSSATASRPARPASKFAGLYGSSRLSEQAHLEYHYVERDLRNIGVLVAVMLVPLIIATIVLNAIGIGPR